MAERDYGQFCGLAHAADLVGERWAILVVRDLLVGPRRFGELQRGLPRINPSVLTTRLKQLEAAGVVERHPAPSPGRGLVYSLTDYGRDLEPVVLALGRWGARSLGDPRPGDAVTPEIFTMALRTTFHPGAAERERTWLVDFGEFAILARSSAESVDARPLDPALAPDTTADLRITAGPAMKALMTGEIDVPTALREGAVAIDGDPALLEEFLGVFRIDDPVRAA